MEEDTNPKPSLIKRIAPVIIFLLLLGGLGYFGYTAVFGSSEAAENSDSGTAEAAGDLAAIPPTLVPTSTPLPTMTAEATSTPLPTATATPQPAQIEVMAPEMIPVGLPSSVRWSVRVVDSGGYVNARITDLSSVMLQSNELGESLINATLTQEGGGGIYANLWEIEGVLDPNTGDGSLVLEITTGDLTEMIRLPWTVGDVAAPQVAQQLVTIDGIDTSPAATVTPLPEVQLYRNETLNLSLDYPTGWFVNEGEGWVEIASDLNGDNLSDGGSYILISAVSSEQVGDPSDPTAVLDWLLGPQGSFADELEIGESEVKEINGRAAAITSVSFEQSGRQIAGYVGALSGTEEAITFVALSADEALEALDGIVQSLGVSNLLSN